MGRVSEAASGTLWAVMNPAARGYAVMRRVLESACRDAGLPAPIGAPQPVAAPAAAAPATEAAPAAEAPAAAPTH